MKYVFVWYVWNDDYYLNNYLPIIFYHIVDYIDHEHWSNLNINKFISISKLFLFCIVVMKLE